MLALLMLQAPHLFAAQRHRTKAKSSVAKKAAPSRAKKVSSSRAKKTASAKPVHKLTKEEVEQAGLLAAERADREQAEKMDPSAKQAQIEDRVHAWMRTHHRAAQKAVNDDNDEPRIRTASKPSSAKSEPRTEEAKSSKPTRSSGKKATAADFDAAAAAQSHAPEPKPTSKPRSAVALPDGDSSENEQVAKDDAPAKAKPEKTASKQQDADDDDDNPQTAELDDDEVPTRDTSAVLRHDSRGRLIVPAPMKGTHEILVHQNVMADREGLDRIEDNDHLNRLRSAKLLVPLPASSALLVNRGLPANRRYTRPWTARFLEDMARAHYARFHEPIQVNSAVRTIEFQRRLIRVNGNAAPPTGETASPHLTGQAIDIAKRGLNLTEIAWMRGYLLPLVQEGKIDVEEEFQQACFHISVYKAYMPEGVHKRKITKHRSPRLLAAGVE